MRFIFLLLVTASLFACGKETNDSKQEAVSTPKSAAKQSVSQTTEGKHFQALMADDKICELLTVNELKSLFPTDATIKMSGHSFMNNYSCTYSWDRVDAEAREKAMLSNMMQSMQDNSKKIPMRQRISTHELTLSLKATKATAHNFMPPKLTEQQLQARIKAAQEAAAKKLSDEQKALAGDMANNMMEKMMQQNNENQAIEGIGDAAYWSKIGGDGLNVLLGSTQLYIAPMIADSMEEDIENAKKIALKVIQ